MEIWSESLFIDYLQELFYKMGIKDVIIYREKHEETSDDIILYYKDIKLKLTDYNTIEKIN